MAWKYLLPLCSLLHRSVYSFLCRTTAFWVKSHLPMFCFSCLCYWCNSHKVICKTSVLKLTHHFLQGVISFWVDFLYIRLQIQCWHMISRGFFFSSVSLVTTFSLWCIRGPIVEDQMVVYMPISLGSLFCSFSLYAFNILLYHTKYYIFKICFKSVRLPSLLFPQTICWLFEIFCDSIWILQLCLYWNALGSLIRFVSVYYLHSINVERY